MKQAIFTIVAATFLVIISVCINAYLENSANTVSTHIKNIQTLVKNNDWDKANAELSQSHETWDNVQIKWAMLIDHKEIDYIEQSFAKLTKYIDTKNLSDILAESETLYVLINHIPEIEKLEWKNIF